MEYHRFLPGCSGTKTLGEGDGVPQKLQDYYKMSTRHSEIYFNDHSRLVDERAQTVDRHVKGSLSSVERFIFVHNRKYVDLERFRNTVPHFRFSGSRV